MNVVAGPSSNHLLLILKLASGSFNWSESAFTLELHSVRETVG